jgi:hypothetical protein
MQGPYYSLLGQAQLDVRSLAAVILRRNVSIIGEDKDNLWRSISNEAKHYVRNELVAILQCETDKVLLRKVSDLIGEIAGSINEVDKEIWAEIMKLVFEMVSSEDPLKIEIALKTYNTLFSYLSEEMMKYKTELFAIFEKTLVHQSLDINVSALSALFSLLSIIEIKDMKAFNSLIPSMISVPMKAL